ncbi:MAG: hypothetical protein JXB13_00635 [Phycisphaerae bacterium]|nr:hypothetical protein [Phycisphaerae bacterium]
MEWFKDHPGYTLVILVILLGVLWRYVRRWRRCRRSSRPVRLHPNLQKYSGPQQLATERRREAQKVLTTSSTAQITGYEIVEQVEAVFVDGFSRPEEALEGLKAAAALKGANALVNVRQERSSAGRYSASGDAVKVASNTLLGDQPDNSADASRRRGPST